MSNHLLKLHVSGARYRVSGTQDRSVSETPASQSADAARIIVRAVLQLGRRLRAQRPKDSVSLSKLAVLSTLHRLGAMPAARLAKEERLQPQSLTRIIAQMERDDLVVRQRGKEDRRTLVIEITRTGRAALRRDIQQRRLWLEAAMSAQLSEAERELLRLSADLMLKVAAFQKSTPEE